MLIVEGGDLVGKTTFVKKLCEVAEKKKYPMIPQHFGLIPEGWNYFEDYLPYINHRTVMDRFILSEIVYGKTVRGEAGITSEQYRLLDAYLRLDGSVTVVLTMAQDLYLRWLDDVYSEHEVFDKDTLIRVNEAFIELCDKKNDIRWGCRPDIDYVIETVGDDSLFFPSEMTADAVLNLYLNRQREIGRLGS